MNALTELKDFKIRLDIELSNFFVVKIADAEKISPEAKEMAEYISDLTLRGGKRIRAALLYYSYLAHGGTNNDEVLKASMSMELSETFLLIHDDIMDNDSLRRGGRTIHESYRRICNEKYHGKIIANHFGKSIAMLTGDIACAWSNEILASSKFKCDYNQKSLEMLNQIYVVECYGQAMDVLGELKDDVKKSDVILVHQLKTVPYTFDGPIKIGAILAGATAEQIKSLEGYSMPLGTAFQIQDDVLGMFGTVEKTGKPVLSDLKEGKKTLLILDALECGNPQQVEIIKRNLGNKKASVSDLKAVREVLIATNALQKSKNLCEKLVCEAIDTAESLELRSPGKDFILGIAEWMVKREY
ncbi:MAG: polyprenyl synthetase family protein [bacterium]